MRLISCHIENFGCLHDFSQNFDAGMTVISRENGWGKSTLAAFLRVMFYGFEGENKRSSTERERKRYEPWQGGLYGGSMLLEHGGRQYRISRIFREREALDELEIRELPGESLSSDFPPEKGSLGMQLFGVDSDTFARTVFIAQGDCPTEANDSIRAGMGDFGGMQDDIGSYEKADGLMKAWLDKNTARRATGTLKKLQMGISELEREVFAMPGVEGSLEQLQQAKAGCEQQLLELQAEEETLQQREQETSLYREASFAREKLEDLQRRSCLARTKRDEARAQFPGEVPDADGLRAAEKLADLWRKNRTLADSSAFSEEEEKQYAGLAGIFARNDRSGAADGAAADAETDPAAADEAAEACRSRLICLRENGEKLRSSEKAYSAALEEKAETYAVLRRCSRRRAVFVGIGILGILAGVAGLLCMPVIQWLPPVILPLLAVLAAALVRYLMRSSVREAKERISTLAREAEAASAEKSRLETAVQTAEKDLRECLRQYGQPLQGDAYDEACLRLERSCADWKSLLQKKIQLERAEAACTEAENDLQAALKPWDIQADPDSPEQTVRQLFREKSLWEEAVQRVREAEAEESAFAAEKADILRQDFSGMQILSEEEIRQIRQSQREKRRRLQAEKRNLTENEHQLQQRLDELEEKREELLQDREAEAALKIKFEQVKQAREYLKKARETLTERYAGPMRASFAGYYAALTGAEPEGLQLLPEGRAVLQAGGKQRETVLLSAGWQDLVGLCLRLALADAVFRREKPPLILDDPFTNLDREKTEAGKKLLLSAAQNRQLLYLTCREERVPETP